MPFWAKRGPRKLPGRDTEEKKQVTKTMGWGGSGGGETLEHHQAWRSDGLKLQEPDSRLAEVHRITTLLVKIYMGTLWGKG